MKKLCSAALALLALLTLLPLRAEAAGREVSVRLNGEALSGTAYLIGGCTYVPIRSFLGALSGSWDVRWEGTTRSAVASGGGHYVAARTGGTTLCVDGTRYTVSGGIFKQDGCTYVPLRLLGTALGLSVRWDSTRKAAAADGAPGAGAYTESDLDWLSRIISAESRGESLPGQIAVGNVVLNRVRSAQFAGSIREVILEVDDGYVQFEPVRNGSVYDAPTEQSVLAARMALAGYSQAGDCLYFFNPDGSSGSWIRANRTYYATIGCHRFYL